MKKCIVLLWSLFMITACGSSEEPIGEEKMEFYKVQLADEIFYFSYPSMASIVSGNYENTLIYNDCEVKFGQGLDYQVYESSDWINQSRQKDGKIYTFLDKDGVFVHYRIEIEDQNFIFLTYNPEGVANCISLVDQLADSWTSDLIYKSQVYDFSVKLPEGFKLEYLPGDEGVVLKKWIEKRVVGEGVDGMGLSDEDEIIIDVFEPYKLEMGAVVRQNFDEFQSIADFVGSQYPGYSIEFRDFGNFSGYFVNETVVLDAVSHFFLLSKDKMVIFDFYLKLPGKRYGHHRKEFEEFVNGAVF